MPQLELVGVGQHGDQPDHQRVHQIAGEHDAEARQPIDDDAADEQEEQHRDEPEDR